MKRESTQARGRASQVTIENKHNDWRLQRQGDILHEEQRAGDDLAGPMVYYDSYCF